MKVRRRDSGEEFTLFDGAVVGRLDTCDWVVTESSISRRHAKFLQVGSIWQIEDLGSSNGIRIRGKKVSTGEFQAGDILTLGSLACEVIGEKLPTPVAVVAEDDPEIGARRRREALRIDAKQSSGLGDLGQLSGGLQALIVILSAGFVGGVIWLIRTLSANF